MGAHALEIFECRARSAMTVLKFEALNTRKRDKCYLRVPNDTPVLINCKKHLLSDVVRTVLVMFHLSFSSLPF